MEKKPNKLMEYFSTPLPMDRLEYLCKIDNIMWERVYLYRDFSISLAHVIFDTYMGDDVVLTEVNRKYHFEWCFKEVIKKFETENMIFNVKGEHFYYFYNHFSECFYENKEKNKNLFYHMVNFWENIFSFEKEKSKSEYDTFVDLYKMMNKYFLNIH